MNSSVKSTLHHTEKHTGHVINRMMKLPLPYWQAINSEYIPHGNAEALFFSNSSYFMNFNLNNLLHSAMASVSCQINKIATRFKTKKTLFMEYSILTDTLFLRKTLDEKQSVCHYRENGSHFQPAEIQRKGFVKSPHRGRGT